MAIRLMLSGNKLIKYITPVITAARVIKNNTIFKTGTLRKARFIYIAGIDNIAPNNTGKAIMNNNGNHIHK